MMDTLPSPNFHDGKSLFGSLSGKHLQIATRFHNEYDYDIQISVIRSVNGNEEYEITGGYAVEIFLYLQALLNFTYSLRPEINPSVFDKSVLNNSVDIYLASYSVLLDRSKNLRPTFVTGQSKVYAFVDHSFETDSSENLSIYINPFSSYLWFCTGIMMTVFIASFIFFNKFEKDSSTGDIIFNCISISLQKGSDNRYFHDSTRVAALTLSTGILVIMASYSGIMTSIFAINRYSINTIEQLTSSEYKIHLELGSASNHSTIKYMLQALATTMPSVQKLLDRANDSKFTFTSFNDSIAEVSRSPVAYIIDEETGLETISSVFDGFPCSWAKIPVFNLKYPWSMYMSKNASFSAEINLGLIQLRERGILRRIRKKWISVPVSTCYAGGQKVTSITYSQIRSAFEILLVIIFGVTPVIFLVEKCVSLI